MTLTLIKNDRVRVDWVELGEGWDGDYDPDDPTDTELLRFDVSRKVLTGDGIVNDEWEEVECGSYCTQMPVDTPEAILVRGLAAIMGEVYDAVVGGNGIKGTCERMSWLCPNDFVGVV